MFETSVTKIHIMYKVIHNGINKTIPVTNRLLKLEDFIFFI